ncbi:hypothetical protein AAFF_G00341190 [Aldrovandia affinis]|uniref:Transmembrane ascorbate-dependent reductase CYB561 n=1 Tax=Aldrovandia affinis TaxID=143900 RepID=A0AAD7SMR3_9TELE|nr:hypothetical protein AAFF_G00341190 [Aldrovandia affinis]
MTDRVLGPWCPGGLALSVGGSQVLGLSCVIITGVWMEHYRGGFAWDGSSLEFNMHPLCMVLGLVFLYGDAILASRVFRNEGKSTIKVLHTTLHLGALVISVVGLVAVFSFHAGAKMADMYSLHSWCGILTLLLYCVQWLMGLGFHLFPGASARLRSRYLPLHDFFGLAVLGLAVASCLLGISEKLLFDIAPTYPNFAPEGILANALGLLLVGFGVLVGYTVTQEDFRRPLNPEEEALSVHFKTLTGEESVTAPDRPFQNPLFLAAH